MALSTIYVQGTELKWVDNNTTFNLTGATPAPGQEQFSGQPVGRIWIATNTALTASFLYYSDYAGQTRFVAGIRKSSGSTAIPGRVTTMRNACSQATASNLYWAGSDNWWHMARAEGILRPRAVTATVSFTPTTILDNQITGSFNLNISEDLAGGFLNYPIVVKDVKIATYTNSTCSPANITIFSSSLTSMSLAAEGSNTETIAMFTTGSTSNYYKVMTASMQIGSGSIFVSRSGDEIFCHLPQHNTSGYSGPGPDIVYINIVDSCTLIPDGGASPGTQVCGGPCHPLSGSASDQCRPQGSGTPGFDDCYLCEPIPDGYICNDPLIGGGTGDCGSICTDDGDCTEGPCPYCISGVCSEEEPI